MLFRSDVMNYEEFLAAKAKSVTPSGFDIDEGELNPALFDFQRAIVKWALKKGKAAMFLDTGLGKTIQQCEWARQVARHTGGNVLIAAPLCVSQQTVEEAAKFGIEVRYVRDQSQVQPGISITNYEMLEHFNPARFDGVCLDESSILKSYTGKIRNQIIEEWGRVKFRLAATATPAPNDYMELGNHSEALGEMGFQDMITRFFRKETGKDHLGWGRTKFHMKGHAEKDVGPATHPHFMRWFAAMEARPAVQRNNRLAAEIRERMGRAEIGRAHV